jgi:hypothetical protein
MFRGIQQARKILSGAIDVRSLYDSMLKSYLDMIAIPDTGTCTRIHSDIKNYYRLLLLCLV